GIAVSPVIPRAAVGKRAAADLGEAMAEARPRLKCNVHGCILARAHPVAGRRPTPGHFVRDDPWHVLIFPDFASRRTARLCRVRHPSSRSADGSTRRL